MPRSAWTWSTTGHELVSWSHDRIIALCRDAGLAGIEGVAAQFEHLRDDELEAVGARYRAAGVGIESFHLPMPPDLASFYETDRRRAVETARVWIERSARLGATVGVQHPSSSRRSVEVEGLDRCIGQLGKSLQTLLAVAEPLNYTIALENLTPGPDGSRLGSRPEHFERFIQAFGHPNLGFALDTGHALVAGGPDHADDFHVVMAPSLVAYHLADNAGDRDSHLAPGHGGVDWTGVFRRAAEIGFTGCMCIETPPFAPAPNGCYGTAAWRRMVEDTDRLVDAALGGAEGGHEGNPRRVSRACSDSPK